MSDQSALKASSVSDLLELQLRALLFLFLDYNTQSYILRVQGRIFYEENFLHEDPSLLVVFKQCIYRGSMSH
jgi:hypothetical protein